MEKFFPKCKSTNANRGPSSGFAVPDHHQGKSKVVQDDHEEMIIKGVGNDHSGLYFDPNYSHHSNSTMSSFGGSETAPICSEIGGNYKVVQLPHHEPMILDNYHQHDYDYGLDGVFQCNELYNVFAAPPKPNGAKCLGF